MLVAICIGYWALGTQRINFKFQKNLNFQVLSGKLKTQNPHIVYYLNISLTVKASNESIIRTNITNIFEAKNLQTLIYYLNIFLTVKASIDLFLAQAKYKNC